MGWKDRAKPIAADKKPSWKDKATVIANNDQDVALSTGRFSDPVMDVGGGGGSAPPQQKESLGRGLLRKGLKALPIAGGIAGGIMGTVAGLPSGPGALFTGAGGAALGAAGGEGWKQLGERYFLGENRNSEEAARGIAEEALSSGAAQLAGNAVGMGGKVLANTGVGKAVIGAAGRGLSKVGEAFTGIPKKAIQTYAKKAPEISKMSKAAGGDVQAAADTIRKNLNSAIQSTKSSLNSQLSKAIEANSAKSIDPTKIKDTLKAARASLNPKLHVDEIKQINELMKKVEAVTGKSGKIALKDAHDLKKYLAGKGKRAFAEGGQIFVSAPEVSRAAKSSSAVARNAFNAEAPAGAAANKGLSVLHGIEDTISPNLLKTEATPAGLLSAGSGSNVKNIKDLKRLGAVTGQDAVGDAEKLYAMKAFDDAPIMPMDFTGKSLTRVGLGAAGGAVAGGEGNRTEGAMVGAALSSPLALKGLLRSGRGLVNTGGLLLQTAGGRQLTGQGLLQIQQYIQKRREEGATDEVIQQEIGAAE